MSDWQDMSTAPKDRRILASGRFGFVGTVKWCQGYSRWDCDPNDSEFNPDAGKLDGWMPLPEPRRA